MDPQMDLVFPIQQHKMCIRDRDNAIPRECTAKRWVPGELSEEVERGCWWFGEDLAKEFGGTDSQAKIALEWADIARDPEGWSLEPCSNEDTGRILSFLTLAPDGVQTMSNVIEGLVETSCNLGLSLIHISMCIRDRYQNMKA